MHLLWRFILTLLFSRFAPPATLFAECRTQFRVLPTDIDVLMHMNNGRYLSLCDLARINFMIRNGAFYVFKKNGIYPVVAAEMIRFRRSLELFQQFDITTQLMGWDAKGFYILHHFKVKQELFALCLVKARFLRKGGGKVDSKEILDLIGYTGEPLQLPEWITTWQDADQAFYAAAKIDAENSA